MATLYHVLAAFDRSLLSLDLAQFRRLANINLDFADGARPRPDIELPRLRQFAAKIQALNEIRPFKFPLSWPR